MTETGSPLYLGLGLSQAQEWFPKACILAVASLAGLLDRGAEIRRRQHRLDTPLPARRAKLDLQVKSTDTGSEIAIPAEA